MVRLGLDLPTWQLHAYCSRGKGMAREAFTTELLELIASRFKVLGEPLRLRLLSALRGGEQTVTELVEETGASQANVSRHLALLHRHRMVTRRKEGLKVYYRIADSHIFELCEVVCGQLESDLEEGLRAVSGGRQQPPPRRQ
jgi:DNA-binding transcriptional ArsR family regulator